MTTDNTDEQFAHAIGACMHDDHVLMRLTQQMRKVFLVCTGEVYEGQETYTRHDDAPPPMCDFEMLLSPFEAAPVVQPVVPAMWQPIETAPSGGLMLVFSRSRSIRIESGGMVHALIAAAALDNEDCFLTHWMPLPAAPASDADSMPAQPTKDAA